MARILNQEIPIAFGDLTGLWKGDPIPLKLMVDGEPDRVVGSIVRLRFDGKLTWGTVESDDKDFIKKLAPPVVNTGLDN